MSNAISACGPCNRPAERGEPGSMDTGNEVVAPANASPVRARARFVIDARRSRFTVQAFAAGMLSAMGHNPSIGIRTFSGEVEFDVEGPTAGALRITIQTASLEVLDDVSDRDRREMEKLMNNEVLEVARYPLITYESSEIALKKLNESLYTADVIGELNFRGTTRRQSLATRIVDS